MLTDTESLKSVTPVADILSRVISIFNDHIAETGLKLGRNEDFAKRDVDDMVYGFSVDFIEPIHGSNISIYIARSSFGSEYVEDEVGNTYSLIRFKVTMNHPTHGGMGVEEADATFTFWQKVCMIAKDLHNTLHEKTFKYLYRTKVDKDLAESKNAEQNSEYSYTEAITNNAKGMRLGGSARHFQFEKGMISFKGDKVVKITKHGIIFTYRCHAVGYSKDPTIEFFLVGKESGKLYQRNQPLSLYLAFLHETVQQSL